jgi:hypothetical protein
LPGCAQWQPGLPRLRNTALSGREPDK